MEEESTIRRQIRLLQQELKDPAIHFTWNDPPETLVEAFLTRGDRKLCDVIQRAWELGAKLDAWGEHFRFDLWQQAFADCDLEMDWFARRQRPLDEILPWEHISAGASTRSSSPRSICTPTPAASSTTAANTASPAAFWASSRSSAVKRR